MLSYCLEGCVNMGLFSSFMNSLISPASNRVFYEVNGEIILASNISYLALFEMDLEKNKTDTFPNMVSRNLLYPLSGQHLFKIIDSEGLCYVVKVIGGESSSVIGYIRKNVFHSLAKEKNGLSSELTNNHPHAGRTFNINNNFMLLSDLASLQLFKLAVNGNLSDAERNSVYDDLKEKHFAYFIKSPVSVKIIDVEEGNYIIKVLSGEKLCTIGYIPIAMFQMLLHS